MPIFGEPMAYEAMINTLSSAKDVDLKKFGQKGKKTLDDLYKEIQQRDVVLVTDAKGRALRVALSVKVIIHGGPRADVTSHRLHETMRELRDTTKIRKKKPWGLSETRRRNEEDPAETVIRGIYEEFGIPKEHVEASRLQRLNKMTLNTFLSTDEFRSYFSKVRQGLGSPDEYYEEHRSSVYPGVWSGTLAIWYYWRMPSELYQKSGYAAKEDGVTVYSRWSRLR